MMKQNKKLKMNHSSKDIKKAMKKANKKAIKTELKKAKRMQTKAVGKQWEEVFWDWKTDDKIHIVTTYNKPIPLLN